MALFGKRNNDKEKEPATHLPKDEENAWFDRDPIKCFRQRILDEGVATEEEIVALEEAVDAEIDDSVEFAKKSPFPSLESAMEDIYAD
jgi:pyruvate dehydrogenase E1 component alpha subunit